LAAGGIGLAAVFYRGGYKEPARAFGAQFPGFLRLVQDKFRVDELYDAVIIRPLKAFARGIFTFVDRIIVDKILVEGTGVIVDVFARIARTVQGGDGQRYMAVFAVGVALLVHFATQPTLPFTKLKVTQTGRAVEVDARRGKTASSRSLDYLFDFGDGRPVIKGQGAEQRHDYDRPGTYTIHVTVEDPRWGTTDTFKEKVEVR
ncbi:MAG TPA: PKD domain-containing protein, partial [Polyangia bacterium]|nr:PKD domain-containing protein [Polyangia bacterium]